MRRFYDAVQARPRQGRDRHARRQARGDPDRLRVREVRQADGHQVGPRRRVPGLPEATPSARTPRTSRATTRAPSRSRRPRPSTRSARSAASRCSCASAASASSSAAPATPNARPCARWSARCPPGVKCPDCGEGEIMEKRSRGGKIFYSCNRYPQCKFATWDRPVPEPCPQCKAPVHRREDHQALRHGAPLLERRAASTRRRWPRQKRSDGDKAMENGANDVARSSGERHPGVVFHAGFDFPFGCQRA